MVIIILYIGLSICELYRDDMIKEIFTSFKVIIEGYTEPDINLGMSLLVSIILFVAIITVTWFYPIYDIVKKSINIIGFDA